MRRKLMNTANNLTLSWCTAAMVVFGSWLPPIIEAPEPPKIGRLYGVYFESE